MRELVRKNLKFFVLAGIAGLVLRAVFVIRFPGLVNDSFVYGAIAKNWLLHGIYGMGGPGDVFATYIRLPGYPAFLAFIFSIFGMEHYRTVLVVQIFVDIGTCLVCADLARRFFGERQAKAAFLLAALCPFLADYSAAALTETLEIFFTALALDFAVTGLQEKRLRAWAGCGACCAGAILLRPDGAMLLFCIVAYLAWRAVRQPGPGSPNYRAHTIIAATILVLISIAPLIPWTLRNWVVFDRFQPLAPRYANEEDEVVPMGFNQWTKTWIADYVSVEEVYWSVPGSPVDVNNLPDRAFDNAQQRSQTKNLIADYNSQLHVSPEIDARFAALAYARIRAHPLRYYVELPLLRVADMWLRPRTEMLPCDSRWWEFNDDPKWSALAIALGAAGFFYLLCALAGWLQVRQTALLGVMTLFVLARSLFLGTLENPEPRYTLEMYPVVILFAAAALVRLRVRNKERAND